MKLLVIPKSINIEKEISWGVEFFLFGIKDFSINCDCSVTIEELDHIRDKYPNISIFISINKNIENRELSSLKNILICLNKMDVAGIFFYDQAILSLHQDLKLSIPLVWNQTHMVTNYQTINYYNDQGVKFAHLSTEITLEEINEIINNTNSSIIVTVLGYPVMSHSKRKLLSHYFLYIKENMVKKRYKLNETNRNESYYIEEDNSGTSFYQSELLNGTSALIALKKSKLSYALIDEKDMSFEMISNIIPLYQGILEKKEMSSEEEKEYISKSEQILGSSNTSFFYKKTIYKVKRNG